MDFLERISQLTSLSEQAYEQANSYLETFNHRKGDVLIAAGRVCNHLYFIRSGIVRGYYHTEKKDITNSIALSGDVITSFYSFITRKASYETLECVEDSEVQAISHNRLHSLYDRFPEIERAGRLILEDYYSRLEERVVSIQFKSAKERYDQLFKTRPALMRHVPLGYIASYLGITQETLSRIRGEV